MKIVYYIFFLIKVINLEIEGVGFVICIELCVKVFCLEFIENIEVKIFICKIILCLLFDDLEVKCVC